MRFHIEGDTYTKYEKEGRKLRNFRGGWSINLDTYDIRENFVIKKIQYITEKAVYTIEATKARQCGFFLLMKGERKWIVPGHLWDVKNLGAENETKTCSDRKTVEG